MLDRVEQFSTMALQVIRDADPEAIHQTRVYSRRVQSALELLPDELSDRIRPLRSQLRRIRRTLNRVRDFDVFIEIVQKRAAMLKNREAYDLLCDRFSTNRQRVLGKVQERLIELGVREFPSNFISAITNPDSALKVDGTSLRVELAAVARDDKAFDKAVEKIGEHWRRVNTFISDEVTFNDSHRLHALRVAIKRLRYVVELASQMSDIHAQSALAKLKSLQAALGEWHDLEMLEIRVIKVIGRPEFISKELNASRSLHSLIAQTRRRKQRVLERLKTQISSEVLPGMIHKVISELKPNEIAIHANASLHAIASE